MKIAKGNKKQSKGDAVAVVDPELEEAEKAAESTPDIPVAPVPKPPSKMMTTSGVEIVEDISDDFEAATTSPAKRAALASAKIADSDSVEVVFLEIVYDYPIIGGFNFQQEFGVSKINRNSRFTVPKHVAMVLLDKKLVTIPALGL